MKGHRYLKSTFVLIVLIIVALSAVVDAVDVSSCTRIDQPGNYQLRVDLTDRNENPCIEITATNVVFDGMGHVLDGSGSGTGVRVRSSAVIVRNLTLTDWYYGIQIDSPSNTVTGCRLENNTFGGKLASGINFTDNIVRNNENEGLIIVFSSGGVVSSNVFESNGGYGLKLYNSRNVDVKNNVFVKDGIYIGDGNSEAYHFHNFSNNTVNGRSLCYINNSKNLSATCGSVIAVSSNNISIVNSNLSYADVGVFIFNVTNFRLENSSVKGDTYGLYAKYSSKVLINESDFESCDKAVYQDYNSMNFTLNDSLFNSFSEIRLLGDGNLIYNSSFNGDSVWIQSDFNTLSKSSFTDLTSGLYISGQKNSILECRINDSYKLSAHGNDLLIKDSYLLNNDYGIEIDGENVSILNNTLVRNNHWAIHVFSSSNVYLENNTAHDHLIGVQIKYSDNVTVESNEILLGSYYGINLDRSDDILIDNTTVSNFERCINSFRSELNISSSRLTNCDYGLYLEETETTLSNSQVNNNEIGIYSESSNLSAYENVVCNVESDFNSTDWLSSYGKNNSCSIPDGWSDDGCEGCTYACFDCSRDDATYIRLYEVSRKSNIYPVTVETVNYSLSDSYFTGGIARFYNFTLLFYDRQHAIAVGSLNIELNSTTYNVTLRGIATRTESGITDLYAVLSGDLTGKILGGMKNGRYTFYLIVTMIGENHVYENVTLNSTYSIGGSTATSGKILTTILKFNGSLCGAIDGEVKLNETRIQLSYPSKFNMSGYGSGSYSINSGTKKYRFNWIIDGQDISGAFFGRLSEIMIGKMKKSNPAYIDGVIYREGIPGQDIANLALKIDGPKHASGGSKIAYDITISNLGFIPVYNVSLDFVLDGLLSFAGYRVEKDTTCNVEKSNTENIVNCKVKKIEAGMEKVITVYAGTPSQPPMPDITNLTVTSKAYAAVSAETLNERIWGERNYLVPSYSPPEPIYAYAINFSDSDLKNDSRFAELSEWLSSMGYHLLPFAVVQVYSDGNYGNLAVFAKDGDAIIAFKLNGTPPLLINMSGNTLRIFDDKGGYRVEFLGYEAEYYGEWNVSHSPTTGDCIENCYLGKVPGYILSTLFKAMFKEVALVEQTVETLGKVWGAITNMNTCWQCYKKWNNESNTPGECNDCLNGVLGVVPGPIYDFIKCYNDCSQNPWSHSCVEGTFMYRCSKGNYIDATQTLIWEDVYDNYILSFYCKDGEWEYKGAESCVNMMYMSNAICVEEKSPLGPTLARCDIKVPKTPSFFTKGGLHDSITTYITFAHDPNAKYVNRKAAHPGDYINFTIEFENVGNGSAYGVYIEDRLDPLLDISSLTIGDMYDYNGTKIASGTLDQATRTIRWDVGEVKPKHGGKAWVKVKITDNISEPTEIRNNAIVFFPSALEITWTNTTVTEVCVKPLPYIFNNTCVNCTSDSDCMQGWFCNESHMCEKINSPPVAIVDFKDTAYVNEEIEFNASKSYDPDRDELTFFWSFGDGSSGVGNVVTHSFSSAGTYNVTLSVFDSKGANNSTTREITILSRSQLTPTPTPTPSQTPSQTPQPRSQTSPSASSRVLPKLDSPFVYSFIHSGYLDAPSWLILTLSESEIELTNLTKLGFRFDERAYIDVRFSKAIPAEGIKWPDVKVYQFNEIATAKHGSGEGVSPVESFIEFRVNKSWLDQYDIESVSVLLWSMEKEEWKAIKTECVGSDQNFKYFKAYLEELGLIAIGGEKSQVFSPVTLQPTKPTVTPEEKAEKMVEEKEVKERHVESIAEKSPGLESILLVIVLSFMAYSLKRRAR
ncbi:MAG: right-handed parallel beta-helix repeat-containing protein [Archaeoglobus sp.]|nr:right-handed parallel beta-helix repeat-containing protein [Archaeoglobus sp.]